MIDVIYLAAGQGKRAGLGYPKQFARLGGKPILIHGLEVLQGMEEVGKIIVACPADAPIHSGGVAGVVASYISLPLDELLFVPGGETRQESVKKALAHVQTEYVLVAEAVRPFITAEFVRQVINTPGEFVVPRRSAVSTVIESEWFQVIPRENVGEVQTPQKYLTALLRAAHAETDMVNASDDAALVLGTMKNIQPTLIPGLEENIKITTPLDLVIAEAIYNASHRDRE
jgi:2-C-methyl-D-erythritol 4-phosphate cytidylyltransferase